MRTAPTALIVAVLVAVAAALASSQEPSAPETFPTTALAFLVGEWSVDETLEPSAMGPGGKGKGEMVARWGPGQQSIVLEYRSTEGPMRGFSLHEIATWDPESEQYALAWVDGGTPGLKSMMGKREDRGFVFTGTQERSGRLFTSESIIEPAGEGFTITSFGGAAGSEPTRIMTLEYRPKGSKEQ